MEPVSTCRFSDSGEDAKVKGPDYLGTCNRLIANSLKYFITELDFSVTGIAKMRVRLSVGVGVRVTVKGKRTRLVNG